jgi:DNA invertase Pin-like site-specific DNA recombinase
MPGSPCRHEECLQRSDVRQRVELGKKWVAAAVAPVSRIARALLVSRQSLYAFGRQSVDRDGGRRWPDSQSSLSL